jgi:hypothetical protein
MTVTDGQRTVAEFKLTGLSGVQGLGFYRLQFSVEVDLAASNQNPARVHEPRAFVFAGPSPSGLTLLGTAVAEISWYAETHPERSHTAFLYLLDLPGERLAALERLRAGGSLHFRLELKTVVESARGWQRGLEQPVLEVSVSTWAQLLKQLGHSEILLVTLELPVTEVPEPLRSSVAKLREAHADLVAARYDGTVGACRLAVDAIDVALGNAGQVEQAFNRYQSGRTQMSKRQRALLVSGAVRHYTHLGHHLNSAGQLEVFSRQDAQFVLAATAAALWDAISELKLK